MTEALGTLRLLLLLRNDCTAANPALPTIFEQLTIGGLRVADARLDLKLSRVGGNVTAAVEHHEGAASVAIIE